MSGRSTAILRAGVITLVIVAFLLPLASAFVTSLHPAEQIVSRELAVLPRVSRAETLRRRLDASSDAERPAIEAELARLVADLDTLRTHRRTLEDRRAAARRDDDEAAVRDADDALANLDARLRAIRDVPPSRGEYWSGAARVVGRNYADVWTSRAADFPLFLRNSLLIALLSVTGMVLSSAVVAYGFARLRWRGRDGMFLLVLATMMIPFPVLMAPLYVLFKHLGWIGSFKPLWVPAWFGGAFSIFLLRQFYLTIPRAIDEAAMLDGCSRFGVFRRMILPLSRPALVVVALFQFIASWNDFVGPLLFLNHQEMFTVSLGLFMYQGQAGGTPWNLVMAASVLATLPVLAVFLLAQRAFLEGIATQGLKS